MPKIQMGAFYAVALANAVTTTSMCELLRSALIGKLRTWFASDSLTGIGFGSQSFE